MKIKPSAEAYYYLGKIYRARHHNESALEYYGKQFVSIHLYQEFMKTSLITSAKEIAILLNQYYSMNKS